MYSIVNFVIGLEYFKWNSLCDLMPNNEKKKKKKKKKFCPYKLYFTGF